MPKIIVRSPFKLRLPDPYRELDFLPGCHEVTAEVAGHWFTRAFSELLPEAEPTPDPDVPGQPEADAAPTAESEPTKRKKE